MVRRDKPRLRRKGGVLFCFSDNPYPALFASTPESAYRGWAMFCQGSDFQNPSRWPRSPASQLGKISQ